MFDSKDFRLDGKVALVTGGTYGIGFAIASALGKAGAVICFNARDEVKVQEAEKAYLDAGYEAHGFVCDVTDEASCQRYGI
jgi:gluconate 5-dehydrogenase